MRYQRNQYGGVLAETCAGLILIVPVLFLFLDATAAIMGQTSVESLAQHAARAAADQPSGGDFVFTTSVATTSGGTTAPVNMQGVAAALETVELYRKGNVSLCQDCKLRSCNYNGPNNEI